MPFAELMRASGSRSKIGAFQPPEDTPHARSDRVHGWLGSRPEQGEGEPCEHRKRDSRSADEESCLDPLTRHLANPVGIGTIPVPILDSNGLQQRMELARAQTLEQMLPCIVRKAAWQIDADRRSATLRLEIGSGMFDGATVLIRADLREVHIELDAPPGIDLEAWKSRLRLRLASQGLIAMIS